MLFLALLSALLFLLQTTLPLVAAKCCPPDAGGDCGDNSAGSSCCGYKPCHIGCCKCDGVGIIREVIELKGDVWTSVITAPAGLTWTCRASHVTTWYPPPQSTGDAGEGAKRAEMIVRDDSDSPATLKTMPHPSHTRSFTMPSYNSQELAHLEDIFAHIGGGRKHNGIGVMNLADYFGFFNITADRKGSSFAEGVEAKFRAHDINNDGLVTLDEAKLQCDRDGCV